MLWVLEKGDFFLALDIMAVLVKEIIDESGL
jgi:hypothetical protein